jgi:DNA-binding GntR family transcriptional regulator
MPITNHVQPYFYKNILILLHININNIYFNKEIVSWIKENLLTNTSFNPHFLEMLHSPHEGITYCLQIQVPSEDDIAQFQQDHLIHLQNVILSKYKDKAFIFDSTMKYL